MRKHLFVYFGIVAVALGVILGIRAMSKHTPAEAKAPAALVEYSPGANRTPGDRSIRAAQGLIERAPSNPKGYNLLASAFMQKARETGDFSLNARAEAALKESFKTNANDYDALKLQAKLLLTYHKFDEALKVARRAQEVNPRDHDVYGALTDALVELGRYPEAVEAAQTMVDLRPETSSYARVSHLRLLHGDTPGAIEAMRMAARAASVPHDQEGAAWCYVQLGDQLMTAGKLKEAEREYDRALFIFPDYHIALAAKARARIAADDMETAINLYTKAQERVPLPDRAIALGDLYKSLGRNEEAARQYKLVEFIEGAGAVEQTYSLQIALFWANHDQNLDKALEIARRERAARADIYTSDVLAWCLYKKGEIGDAKAAIDEALRLGTRDARIHYHAGMIYKALDDRSSARKHLKLALEIDPTFNLLQVAEARQTLAS